MSISERTSSACGKIILTGEYAVVFGYAGIAVPALQRVKVTFEEADQNSVFWPSVSDEWITYANDILECCRTISTIPAGKLSVACDIPLGKGMGASTAVLIAIARCMLGEDCGKEALAMEDAMNEGHSGLDFAVIWAEHPVLFMRGETPRDLELPDTNFEHPVLVDTGSPNETTAELVAMVQARAGEPEISAALRVIGECTERLLAGEDIRTIFRDHHRAQIALGVVPEETRELIEKIENLGGAAKVIGAGGASGGGGMVLSIGIEEPNIPGEFPTIPL